MNTPTATACDLRGHHFRTRGISPDGTGEAVIEHPACAVCKAPNPDYNPPPSPYEPSITAAFHLSGPLLRAMEQHRGRIPRSQWLREAVLHRLRAAGYDLPEEAALPPDRTGKGGRPRTSPTDH